MFGLLVSVDKLLIVSYVLNYLISIFLQIFPLILLVYDKFRKGGRLSYLQQTGLREGYNILRHDNRMKFLTT